MTIDTILCHLLPSLILSHRQSEIGVILDLCEGSILKINFYCGVGNFLSIAQVLRVLSMYEIVDSVVVLSQEHFLVTQMDVCV